MIRMFASVAVTVLFTSLLGLVAPAHAGDDSDHQGGWRDYYDAYAGYGGYSAGVEIPQAAPHVYLPYASYFAGDSLADLPYVEGRECEIKRKWKHGRVTEKVKCNDD